MLVLAHICRGCWRPCLALDFCLTNQDEGLVGRSQKLLATMDYIRPSDRVECQDVPRWLLSINEVFKACEQVYHSCHVPEGSFGGL